MYCMKQLHPVRQETVKHFPKWSLSYGFCLSFKHLHQDHLLHNFSMKKQTAIQTTGKELKMRLQFISLLAIFTQGGLFLGFYLHYGFPRFSVSNLSIKVNPKRTNRPGVSTTDRGMARGRGRGRGMRGGYFYPFVNYIPRPRGRAMFR